MNTYAVSAITSKRASFGQQILNTDYTVTAETEQEAKEKVTQYIKLAYPKHKITDLTVAPK